MNLPRPAAAMLLLWAVACSSGQGPGGTGSHGGTGSGTGPTGSGTGGGAATSSSSGSLDGGGGGAGDYCKGGTVGGARPVEVRVPASYNCTKIAPLVILLHDYASSGVAADTYLGLGSQADAQGFLYVHPDGTKDSQGNEFWNATDACCNADGSTVDDSTYLSTVIDDIRAQYNVDPKRVYVVGYGNGGFMAHRMACDHALQITAAASLGGATWADSTKCGLKAPVSVLEIHGTADATFAYGGGTHLGHAYPSAGVTLTDWAKLDKCSGGPDTSAPPLDLDSSLPGAETTVTTYTCVAGTNIELWSIQGGTHAPQLSPTFASTLLGFLLAHKKP